MDDEIDFDVDNDSSNPMYERTEKRHDYGYPDPDLGQKDYKLNAFDFSSGATKPVRFVPARSGDNAMVDNSNAKSLQTYMQEVDEGKKKVLDEVVAPNQQNKNPALAAVTSGVEVDDNDMAALAKIADKRKTTSPNEPEAEVADDIVDAATDTGAIDPNTAANLTKSAAKLRQTSAMEEQTFSLPLIDEDEIEEKKRRFSFSHDEFGKGIVTSPRLKLRRAARRGLGK